MKKLFSLKTKAVKVGSYSSAMILIAIVVVILINLLMSYIPVNFTHFDTTDSGINSVSVQTKDLVTALDQNITIYYIVTANEEHDTINELLNQYAVLSPKITIEKIDPDIYPRFYEAYSDESLNNCLVVESGERFKVITYDNIFVETAQNGYSFYYFDGEASLTNAIDYVISDDLPIIYNITGHGEKALSDNFENAIYNQNIDVIDMSLLDKDSIPDDADAILIMAPSVDFTDKETQMIKTYLSGGGKMLLISNYTTGEMPNFTDILNTYGVELVEGMVVESDMDMIVSGYPNYILPEILSHDITDPLINNSYRVIIPLTQGIKELDQHRDTVHVTPLLSTSDQAYSKIDVYNSKTIEKEDGDIDGPFDLAVAITETVEGDETKIVCFATSMIDEDVANELSSYSNTNILINSLGWMLEKQSSISILARPLTKELLNLDMLSTIILIVVFTVVIPVLPILIAIIVWLRRKSR